MKSREKSIIKFRNARRKRWKEPESPRVRQAKDPRNTTRDRIVENK